MEQIDVTSKNLSASGASTAAGQVSREVAEAFESRKSDHIRASMDPAVQAGGAGFDEINFVHEALPDLNFDEVSIQSQIFRASKRRLEWRLLMHSTHAPRRAAQLAPNVVPRPAA